MHSKKSFLQRQLVASLVLVAIGGLSHTARAGEVDLAAAGCPEPPGPGRFMAVHLILNGDGTGKACTISSDPSDFCEQYHSFEEGFLCVGLTHNPRPDITAAETTNSMRVDRLLIDGVEVEESFGKTILRQDLATGPSGERYEVVAEHRINGVLHSLIIDVSATPDGPVTFHSVRVLYEE
jgi:hypothetical protein